MNIKSQPVVVTPKLENPEKRLPLRTGVRAGERGVTHTDNWRENTRR